MTGSCPRRARSRAGPGGVIAVRWRAEVTCDGGLAPMRSRPLKTNAAFHALPFVEPIAYGAEPISEPAVSQERLTATRMHVAAIIVATRFRRGPGSATQAPAASAGTGTTASSSLTLKATPTHAAATRTQRARPVWVARTSDHNAAIRSRPITASIVSLRAVSTATGNTASASAAPSAATVPNTRRTAS